MIAEKILGTWTLVESKSELPDGTVIDSMGNNPQGLLCYSSDGYVSVNLMRPDRVPPRENMVMRWNDEEAGHIARGYVAYAGPYHVDEAAGIIHHMLQLCLDPTLINTPQPRLARFVGELLELGVPSSPQTRGLYSYLRWRRASFTNPRQTGAPVHFRSEE